MTLWPLFSSASLGFRPSPDQVHLPNSALPSCANLDVPQPVSFAACARANDTGTSSILIFKVDRSLEGIPYCLYFFSNHFFSKLVLLFLLIIPKSLFLSNRILLFSCNMRGNTIWIKNSFRFLVFSIILISRGNESSATGFTNLFFLISCNL